MSETEYERLKRRVQDQQKYQDQERVAVKKREQKPNLRMEEGTPDKLSLFDFWCDNCQEDFSAPCYKTRHRLYGDWIAVWRTICPFCENGCIRHITHKDEDVYYLKSEKIREQREKFAWDVLQPGDSGFRMAYGEPYEAFERKMAGREEDIIKTEREEGLRGKSLKTQDKLRKLRRGWI